MLAIARFLADVPGFLRRPVDPVEARRALEVRRGRRGADFLALVHRAVYARPDSPYRALLAHAGCAYGDLVELVERDGLEGALLALFCAGVFVTLEELKGRQPIVRGSRTFETRPEHFRNQAPATPGFARTSGSRGPAVPVPISLRFLAEIVGNMRLTFEAWGPGPWRVACWDVPGSTVFYFLAYAKCGMPPVSWFSPVGLTDPAVAASYRWGARATRWVGQVAGARLPAPVVVPVHAPLTLVEWMRTALAEGRKPLLLTYTSPAVRLCRAARDAGIDLSGAELRLYGEPLTAARLAAIRQSGADARAIYATAEAWRIGEPCLNPDAPDDVHLVDDVHALVQPGDAGARPGLPPRGLLLTSLRQSAPIVLFNASLGDEAVVSTRQCGCPIERLGWTTHLSAIRSHEKLTASGMTFLDVDVIRVLDETLPARFGGGPTDYQLVEDETPDGRPRIRLLVHPALGPLDPATVSRAFLEAVGTGVGAPPIMARLWRDADVISVERRPPLATASGKILHVRTGPPGVA